MKLVRPFPKSTIEQYFGDNATTLYSSDGLKGHPGEDYVVPWGTSVPCVANDSYCYSVLNKDNPDLSKYRAPCFIVEDETGVYEIIYGHVSDILAVPGKTYSTGDFVSKVGNTGPVFVGSHEVTSAEKATSAHPGSHLHLQVRLLEKSATLRPGKQHIVDENGLLKRNGFYYDVVNYNNGFNGCVDPEPFFGETTSYAFTRDLFLGETGEDVRQLQMYLNAHNCPVAAFGPGSKGNETTYFGTLTEKALAVFQRTNEINPAKGYFGPITKIFIKNHT